MGFRKERIFCDMNWQSSSFQVCFVHLEFNESDSTMDIHIDEDGGMDLFRLLPGSADHRSGILVPAPAAGPQA